jgi:hypothetical protein
MDGSGAGLLRTAKGGSLHGVKSYSASCMLTLHIARMCSGAARFMLVLAFHPQAFLGGRRMLPIGLSTMHKVVLGSARVIRQLENVAHSHSGGLSPSTGWT